MLDKNSRVSSTGYFAEDLPEAMLARSFPDEDIEELLFMERFLSDDDFFDVDDCSDIAFI